MELLRRAAAAPPAEAHIALEAALRAANDRLWVARNVARLYREHVGDLAAARRAIAALEPLTCLEHRLVAAAWSELGEPTTAAAILERAAANARLAGDLCTVAMGYLDVRYDDEARLLVDGAARVATHAMDAWIVAGCYRDAFGEAGRARELLATTARDATAVTELVTLARALAAHEDLEASLELVRRAERVAVTVHDWIEASVGCHTILLDAAAADRCVDRAARLATSPQDERAIAIARGRLHLGVLDDERPRLPPSKLLRAGPRSFAWDRDADRLLGWLRARIPRTSINTLARADQYFTKDDLVTLLELQKTGHVPHPLPAYLDIVHQVSQHTGPGVDHLLRAFCCTLVCIDDAAAVVPGGIEPTIATLLDSCLALGPDAVAAASALFAAMADAYHASHATTTLGYLTLFAELGLVLAATWLDPSDPRIAPLIARMIEDEAHWRGSSAPSGDWLLGLTAHDGNHARWRALARTILVSPNTIDLAGRLGAGRDR